MTEEDPYDVIDAFDAYNEAGDCDTDGMDELMLGHDASHENAKETTETDGSDEDEEDEYDETCDPTRPHHTHSACVTAAHRRIENTWMDQYQIARWISMRASQMENPDTPIDPKIYLVAVSLKLVDPGMIAAMELFLNIPLTMIIVTQGVKYDPNVCYIPFGDNPYLCDVYYRCVVPALERGLLTEDDLRVDRFTGQPITCNF